jgi:hypothetical protein
VLLSGLPLPDARLSTLDQQQRHIVANARILLPFSGRFNWENALRTYASIEEKWRSYRVNPDMLENQVVYNLQTHQERSLQQPQPPIVLMRSLHRASRLFR